MNLFTTVTENGVSRTYMLCRMCKAAEGTIKVSKRLMKDGSVRHYKLCRKCNTERCMKWRNNGGMKSAYEAHRRFCKKNPEKQAAYKAVYSAKVSGKLVPEPCDVCGKTKVVAHHDDYSAPLDVRWMCSGCLAEHLAFERRSHGL